jgi:hypothetical protein
LKIKIEHRLVKGKEQWKPWFKRTSLGAWVDVYESVDYHLGHRFYKYYPDRVSAVKGLIARLDENTEWETFTQFNSLQEAKDYVEQIKT